MQQNHKKIIPDMIERFAEYHIPEEGETFETLFYSLKQIRMIVEFLCHYFEILFVLNGHPVYRVAFYESFFETDSYFLDFSSN